MTDAMKTPTVTLAGGVEMPAVGFGVFQIRDLEVCEQAVLDALQAGFRFIDTAAAYGNEAAVGRAIRRSGIPRDELFVSTKVWVPDTTYEGARAACERSLDLLELDYLDLYFIHQPYNDVFGAWRALVELQGEGRIRALGVDNMNEARLADFLTFNERPAVNFLEINPLCQQQSGVAYQREREIQPLAWSPLGSGGTAILENEVLADIARSHGKSVAQVVLRWLIQRGIVPVVKSTNPERMRENLDLFDFELSEAEMDAIRALDTGEGHLDRRNTGSAVEKFLASALSYEAIMRC